MVTLLAWLAETIGLKGMAKGLVKWGLRLALLALLLVLARVVWVNPGLRQYAIAIAVLGLFWAVFHWLRRYRRAMKWGLRLLVAETAASAGKLLPRTPFAAWNADDLLMLSITAIVGVSLVWDGFQWWRIRKREPNAGRAIARLVMATVGVLALLFLAERVGIGEPVLWLITALLLVWGAFQWWRGRNDEANAGERTIDGKLVPDKLAVAALPIPASSPDGDYVLRGLPEYGKALLKLEGADFEYVPEISEPELDPVEETPLSESEPEQTRSWPWRLIPAPEDIVCLLLIGAGLMLLAVYPHPNKALAATLWLAWGAATVLTLTWTARNWWRGWKGATDAREQTFDDNVVPEKLAGQ